jgi:hypothetical protein
MIQILNKIIGKMEVLMKRLITFTAFLFTAVASCGYADSMRLTVINDSSVTQNLNIGKINQNISLSPGEVKMLTVDYRYPDAITMFSVGGSTKNCNWAMPPIGKQTIQNLTLNISNTAINKSQDCSISFD